MKWQSASLSTKEMQISATKDLLKWLKFRKINLTPNNIKKKNWIPYASLLGMENGPVTLKNSWSVSSKIKYVISWQSNNCSLGNKIKLNDNWNWYIYKNV